MTNWQLFFIKWGILPTVYLWKGKNDLLSPFMVFNFYMKQKVIAHPNLHNGQFEEWTIGPGLCIIEPVKFQQF
jgi:hypothetical protein